MKEYQSIKPKVLARIKRELPVLRERYGIETIGIFGSVSRREDTPESDLDIIYSFRPEMDTYENLLDLGDFLEDLFLRKVDLVSVEWMSERFRASVMTEAEGWSEGTRQRLHHDPLPGQHRGESNAVLQRGGCRGMHRIRGLDLQRREASALSVIEQVRDLAETIRAQRSVSAIILYGSFARGDFHEGSDIDLIVVGDFRERPHKAGRQPSSV